MTLNFFICKKGIPTVSDVIVTSYEMYIQLKTTKQSKEMYIFLDGMDVGVRYSKTLSQDIMLNDKYCEVTKLELVHTPTLDAVLKANKFNGSYNNFLDMCIQQIRTIGHKALTKVHRKNPNIASANIMESGVYNKIRTYFKSIFPAVWVIDPKVNYVKYQKVNVATARKNNLIYSATSTKVRIKTDLSSEYAMSDDEMMSSINKYAGNYVAKNNLKITLAPVSAVNGSVGMFTRYAMMQMNSEENQETVKRINDNSGSSGKPNVMFTKDDFSVYDDGSVSMDKVKDRSVLLARIVSIANIGGFGLYGAFYILALIAYDDAKADKII